MANPETREKRLALNRENRYDIDYRERRMAEDPEGFRRHLADVHNEWSRNNRDHLRHYHRTHFNTFIGERKRQAQTKRIPWNLTDDQALVMCTSPCVYCGFLDGDGILNGIDRLNNNGAYDMSNTVSCCVKCNYMKMALDPVTFIRRCAHLVYTYGGPGEFAGDDAWKKYSGVSFAAYKARAEKKGLTFELQEHEFKALCQGKCAYCGKTSSHGHRNGVDRKDNEQGYVRGNVLTCCGDCNYLKCDLTMQEFFDQLNAVNKLRLERGIDRRFYRTPKQTNPIAKRETAW
ncbi:uncharacterized protein BJ171DRAFT_78300 [Polychytrium aggregatum]|uniref:uncharacterized protein n=1 Tax=Polychytrium aggregatum TaxID=110093 RepID=UPI0022FEB8A7|nr:uncharacterized protein BJ171DRAFT_78300 [Polychytrium aggregatum]KAI9190622.1 hypothetical protein BJ171DRAFT_78300 [Polychytrium aggregatum]